MVDLLGRDRRRRLDPGDVIPINVETDGMRQRAVTGGIWTTAAQLLTALSSAATLAVTGRLLEQEDFGLVAMAAVFSGVAGLFVDAGLSAATVQRERVTHQQVSNLFWISAALGVALMLIVTVMGPVAAWVYGKPQLTGIMAVTGLSFALFGFSSQQVALVKRAMRFRLLTVIRVVALTVSQSATIALAWWLSNYWALVLGALAAPLASMFMYWTMTGWFPTRPRRGAGTRTFVVFGANLLSSQSINYLARNVDNFLIGWWWGPGPLGAYERGYRLLTLGLGAFATPIAGVAVPTLSRLQDKPETYRSFFRRGQYLFAVVQLPVVVIMAVMPHELVRVALGPGWEASGDVLRGLTLSIFVGITGPATVWVYPSWGHTDRMLKAVIVTTILVLTGFAIALPYGPVAMAWAFSITQAIARLPSILYCIAPTPLQVRDIAKPVWRPLLAGLVGGGVVASARAAGVGSDFSPALSLAAGVGAIAMIYVQTLLLLPGGLSELRAAIRSVRSR